MLYKSLIVILTLLLLPECAVSQIQKIADQVSELLSQKSLSDADRADLETLRKSLKVYRDFKDKEKKPNGKVGFGFTGNESDLRDIFKIAAGIEMEYGIYPLELDIKFDFQAVTSNGELEENVSDIDISLDYHPKLGNGLALETYTFVTRFNNTYLSIDHRWEAGAGVIFNFFSTGHLTSNGRDIEEKLSALPEYKVQGDRLWSCYDNACRIMNASDGGDYGLTADDIKHISDVRYDYDKVNKKNNSKLRLAMLIGIHYENEKARLETLTKFNSVPVNYDIDFDETNKLRWQIRPTLVYKPDDIFTFKFYPYFKFPLTDRIDVVRYDENVFDERVDKFYDIQASLIAKITPKISFGIRYRYMKDFAPKRTYFPDINRVPVLIIGQETNSFYNIDFSYDF